MEGGRAKRIENSELKVMVYPDIPFSVFCFLLWCVGKTYCELVKWLNNSPITSYQLPMFEKGG
jgi:hypothetical protein